MPIETMTDHTLWLTLAVFFPIVGVVALMFVNRRDEQTDQGHRHRHRGRRPSSPRSTSSPASTSTTPSACSSSPTTSGSSSSAPTTSSASTASASRCSCCRASSPSSCSSTRGTTCPTPATPRRSSILTLILQVGMAGTFVAQDLILFFVFFEVVLLPMYFMIGVWGGENRMYASLKFFLFTMFGSALMLVAFLALFFQTGAESFSFLYLTRAGRRHRPRRRRSGSSPGCSSASPSRCRCSRSTPGFPMPTRRRPRRVGDPGRDPAEAGHLRVRAHRHPVPARRCQGVGTGDRHPRRDRHHLRRAVLPRPDRPQAARRLLLGGPHGLRDARHLDADDVRHQRGVVRDGRPRPHHRDAVLHRRVDQAPLPHAVDQSLDRDARVDATAGVGARFLRHGQSRPSWARRVLGRVPGDPVGVQPAAGRRALRAAVPNADGDRRHRHRVRRRLPAVAVPAHGVRLAATRVRR